MSQREREKGPEVWSWQSAFPQLQCAELAGRAWANVLAEGIQPVAWGHGVCGHVLRAAVLLGNFISAK